MPSPWTESAQNRRRRAPMACEFCRRRKMKCNNEKPQCLNCKEHGKHCVYAELPKQSRPTFARITELEQENRRLNENLTILKAKLEASKDPSDLISSSSISAGPSESLGNRAHDLTKDLCKLTAAPPQCRRDTSVSYSSAVTSLQKTFSPDKESQYHGPSAVCDEKSVDSGVKQNLLDVEQVWVKRQLVAESANQRQLETVNFLAGKLDFDGVKPELGFHLLAIYWNRQQSFVPIVYRTAFMRDMARAGPFFSKLLLNTMYLHASKYTSRTEVRRDPNNKLTAGWIYRQRAVELLSQTFDKSEITTVQALLIMSSVLFSWCDEKSISWLYAGMAFNMIIDLGVHVDALTLKRRFSEEEQEIRLRVFWSAFVLDKLQSLYQGRPPCLRESVTNLPMVFLDNHEELELFSPVSYTEASSHPMTPVYSISTFTETCKLSIILDKILLSFYAENTKSRRPSDLLVESQTLHAQLEDWRNSLPEHLDIKSSNSVVAASLPHILALTAMFNTIVILLHRPFVSDGHLQSASVSVALDAFSICSDAAFEIDDLLKTYERSYCIKSTPYILSYANYFGATIHVRLAAQRERGSNAHKALRRCLEVLETHATVCWASRRAKRVIDGLVERMEVSVENEENDITPSVLTSSNFDIEALMRTFAPQPSSRESTAQFPTPSSIGSGIGSYTTNCYASQSPNTTDQYVLFGGQTNPATSSDMNFLYDPIFGLGGTSFNDLDWNFDLNYSD